jgi:hypothetical protein
MLERRRLIVLTDKAFGLLVTDFLDRAVPALQVICALTSQALAHAPTDFPLIGFLTRHYVPPALCRRGNLPAYNIHPGTPDYPGWMPEIRAARDKAPVFGATLHEMTPVIDAGAIIATEYMPAQDAQNAQEAQDDQCAPDADAYARIGFECALVLLGRFARAIAEADQPLTPNGQNWTGALMLRAEVEALMAGEID